MNIVPFHREWIPRHAILMLAELVERVHIRRGQRETENIAIARNMRGGGRFSDTRKAVFDLPSQQYLRPGFRVFAGQRFHHCILGNFSFGASKWRVRLDRNALLRAILNDMRLLQEWRQLNLITHWPRQIRTRKLQFLQMSHIEVTDTDTANVTTLLQLVQRAIFVHHIETAFSSFVARVRRMNQHQINVVEVELSERLLNRQCRLLCAHKCRHFGGDKHVTALHHILGK
mmetsp:Transcript_35879/g.58889  ORF Transcript_35879/g.58889 Transcript_35879/m.58889 type:complete len:230 (+) Transcript_35879:1086-1775(+)